jgi:hypothetical protein
VRFLLAVPLTAILLATAPTVVSASTDTYFASPSKTIGCAYERLGGRVSVTCDLAHVDHPKPAPANCPLDYGDSFALRAHGKANRRCHGDTVFNPHARVLAYGKTKHFGPFTCRVRKTTGMRCTSRSGHGFRVSRQHQKLW